MCNNLFPFPLIMFFVRNMYCKVESYDSYIEAYIESHKSCNQHIIWFQNLSRKGLQDSKVHGANMGPCNQGLLKITRSLLSSFRTIVTSNQKTLAVVHHLPPGLVAAQWRQQGLTQTTWCDQKNMQEGIIDKLCLLLEIFIAERSN